LIVKMCGNLDKLPIGENYPWLAPLSGYSDLAFRILCRRLGCSVAYTEMVSAKGLIYRSLGCQKIIKTCDEDRPLIVQIFGSEPDVIEEALRLLKDQGFLFFDLNAGCPVKKVIKTGSGAALLKDTNKLFSILERMVKIGGEGKVGVKMRSGWFEREKVFLEVGTNAKDLGLGWVVLHPRAAVQKFSGKANWELLKELKEICSVPVIASGDLFTAEDAKRCLSMTKADGIMFARGALNDPLIFEEFLKGKKSKSVAEVIKMHVEIIKKYMGEEYHVPKLRGIISRYLKNFPYASFWRKKVMELSSWSDVDRFLEEFSEKEVKPWSN